MAEYTGAFGRISRLKLSWEDKATGTLRIVRFDVVTAETYEALVSITSHPVEKGADVADHAREEPISLTIEGFLSYTPLYHNPGVDALAGYANKPLKQLYPPKLGGAPIFTPGGLVSAVGGAIGDLLRPASPPEANVLHFTAPDAARKRVLDKVADLQRAKGGAARMRVLAGGGAHDLEDMMIARLSLPRTPEDAGGVVVQLEIRQVRIVSSEIVAAPKSAEARGQPTVNTGSKGAEPASDKQKAQAKSLALQGFQGIGLLGGGGGGL